jgi:hypothetical protein
MAKQPGNYKTGTLHGITYYKDPYYGYLAREKSSLDKERVERDPAFRRTQENASDFGKTSVACRVFRTAFSELLQRNTDRTMQGRLMKAMMKVIRLDTAHMNGRRERGTASVF